ncbi:hypothetical protein I308_100903 [Cryptococcus tetragattii IND107]|uniref:Uncharacterized protein n=1 Tax=Cryptococcus tetragattii IND107 TaxID=1296105 RepID=A0ABR3C058_9TREE
MIPFYKPIPAPPAIFKDQPLPEQNANFLPKILFHWVTPVMKAGYSRLLEADDLWNLATDLKCKTVSDHLRANFLSRTPHPSAFHRLTLLSIAVPLPQTRPPRLVLLRILRPDTGD